jgi:hypothetical protein
LDYGMHAGYSLLCGVGDILTSLRTCDILAAPKDYSWLAKVTVLWYL